MPPVYNNIGILKVNGIQNSGSINIGWNVLNISSHNKMNRASGENFGDDSNLPIGATQLNDPDLIDHPGNIANVNVPF